MVLACWPNTSGCRRMRRGLRGGFPPLAGQRAEWLWPMCPFGQQACLGFAWVRLCTLDPQLLQAM
eukprot:7242456-Karenia_brevis.AAC.1